MPSATVRARVWCLNLDAEEELRRGAGYAPTRATLAAVAAARHGALGLLAPGDVLLDAQVTLQPGAYVGAAWCPTPRARALLGAAGATLAPAPALDILQRVNASRFPYDVFCEDSPERLPGARVVHDREEAEAWLAACAPSTGAWLKRAFGAAGRGKLRVSAGKLVEHARAFLTADELTLGVVLEPHVAVTLEVSQHGHLARDGTLVLGAPCVQQVDRGRFTAVRLALPGEVHETEREELHGVIGRLADALRREGYFGPFGVDAYRYEDERGRARWNPCSELNARYTMGYATGIGAAHTKE